MGIVCDCDFGQALHPPHVRSSENNSVLGPDNKGHGLNWCLKGTPGDVFRIILQKLQDNAKLMIHWELVDHQSLEIVDSMHPPCLTEENQQSVSSDVHPPCFNPGPRDPP